MAKKIKVVLSNNEVYYVTRPWYFFWMFDGFGSHAFVDEDGEIIKFGNHWMISQKNIEASLISVDKAKYAEGLK
jgi:hypothetical protein